MSSISDRQWRLMLANERNQAEFAMEARIAEQRASRSFGRRVVDFILGR